VERGAWRNVDPAITAPFSAICQCKGQHSSAPVNGETAAHWGALASQQTGETASFDDIGRLLASIYGIQYGALIRDEASRVAVYGLESKKDLVDALRKYCQFEACGKDLSALQDVMPRSW
jgi:hypothetical protein